MTLGVFGLLVVAMFGRELLLLFYTAEFAEYSPILTIAAVVGAVNYVSAFLGFGMNAVRYFKAQMVLQLLVLAVTTLSCMVLVPAYGLAGAVVSIGCSTGVQALGGLLVCIYAVVGLSRRRGAGEDVAPPRTCDLGSVSWHGAGGDEYAS
jgi:O-antigen/teichoic acid export membrane protein